MDGTFGLLAAAETSLLNESAETCQTFSRKFYSRLACRTRSRVGYPDDAEIMEQMTTDPKPEYQMQPSPAHLVTDLDAVIAASCRLFPHSGRPPHGRMSPSLPRVSCPLQSAPFFQARPRRSSCETPRLSGAFDRSAGCVAPRYRKDRPESASDTRATRHGRWPQRISAARLAR